MPRSAPNAIAAASFRRWKKIPVALLGAVFLALFSLTPAGAVEDLATSSFNTNAPTASDIPNWTTGWPASGLTGWNYVGTVGGASGVYLRNGWVITARHVNSGNFVLGGVTYTPVPGSTQYVTNSNGTADLALFQIASPPSLPALTIATSAPKALSTLGNGSSVAMIGYGQSTNLETWGLNTVTANNVQVTLTGYDFDTTDFETAYGTTTDGTYSATNNYSLYVGDSGGGDFIYKSSTSTWLLAGLNEALDDSHDSYFIQLSTYVTSINTITNTSSTPGVTTAAATAITETGATLNGTVNAEGFSTTVSFDYGVTTGYGTNVAGTPSPVTGTNQNAVSTILTGLSPGTTYHFRVDGVNSVGTSNGGDLTFTTLQTPLQSWRTTYYASEDNSGDAADTADPYETGVPNLAVFAFFGPSQDPAQALISQLPQPQLSGGTLFYSFTQPSGVSGVTYGAQWTATLQPGSWTAISDTGSGSQHLFSVPMGSNSQLFIRLTVTEP